MRKARMSEPFAVTSKPLCAAQCAQRSEPHPRRADRGPCAHELAVDRPPAHLELARRSPRSCSPRPWRPGMCACAQAGPRAESSASSASQRSLALPAGQFVERAGNGRASGSMALISTVARSHWARRIASRRATTRSQPTMLVRSGWRASSSAHANAHASSMTCGPGADVARDEAQQALCGGRGRAPPRRRAGRERMSAERWRPCRLLSACEGDAGRRPSDALRRSGTAPTGARPRGTPIGLRGAAACGRG